MSEWDRFGTSKILLSQKFRHLMRCKKYLENNFLSCLVSEIQLFVYIFWQNSKWPPKVRKDRGGMKLPYDFLFTFVTINQLMSTTIHSVFYAPVDFAVSA